MQNIVLLPDELLFFIPFRITHYKFSKGLTSGYLNLKKKKCWELLIVLFRTYKGRCEDISTLWIQLTDMNKLKDNYTL